VTLDGSRVGEGYYGRPPSEGLKSTLRDIVQPRDGGVDTDRVHELPDHERYFFQVVHGTIEQKGTAPEELLRFLSQIAGTDFRIR